MKTKILLSLFFCVFLSAANFAQRKMPVSFVRAESGDVLIVKDTHYKENKLFIPFIETPSKEQSPMFAIAKQHLEDLVKNKKLEVVVLDVGFGYYNALYGTLLADGRDIGLQMIRDGAAWHFVGKESIQKEDQKKIYYDNQDQARIGKLGIWGIGLQSPTELKKLKIDKYKKLIPQDDSAGYIKETKAQLVENWSLYETEELRVGELLAVKADLFNKFNHGRVDLTFILFAAKKAYNENTKIKITADSKEIPLYFSKFLYKERMKGLYQDTYDGIELINSLEFFDFIDLANSKKVTIEVDGKSYDFNKNAFDGFKALAKRIEF